MSDDLPREIGRGIMQIGPLEIEVINLDNGQRLVSPESLEALLSYMALDGVAGPLKNITPEKPA